MIVVSDQANSGCPHCAALSARLRALEAQVAELQRQLAAATKNSATSSKPPSSDIVKPKLARPKGLKKRKRGAQPGHPRHERERIPAHEVDYFWTHDLAICPDCGGPLDACAAPPKVQQQIEVVERPIEVHEHHALAGHCAGCNRVHYAEIPEDIRRAGLAGPRLTALVAYLKSACHCSFTTIRKFLRDVVQVKLSRGFLRKLCAKVSDSLEECYEQLRKLLPTEDVVNVDETGHKDDGRRLWTWCFRAATFTLFKISPSRGSEVLVEILGKEFEGVLGCDYFSAYRKYMHDFDVLVQFCLAHLIRDLKFLAEHPDPENRAYGKRVLQAVRTMFGVIHREAELGDRFASELEDAGWEVVKQATFRVPAAAESQNLANRFRTHGLSYIRFITTPGVDPTNNLAEQAIRFVVIDRHVTQGTRGESGQRWLERIWSVIATCTQHGRSVFEFLDATIRAHFQGEPPPRLLPDSS